MNVNNKAAASSASVEISSAWLQLDEQGVEQEVEPCPFWLPTTERCTEVLNAGLRCLAGGSASPLVNVSLRFATSGESRELNESYRGSAKPTNVLSFPVARIEELAWPQADVENSNTEAELLGDLVLCPEVIAAEATQQNKSPANHWAHLLLHGLFHLFGYDHLNEDDANEMEALEIRALENLGIANPYLLD